MAKTPVSLHMDGDLLANLTAYATRTGCTVTELIERFCQQGLEMAPEGSIPALDAHVDKRKNNLLAERVDAVEMDVKSVLKRLFVLESKVDVDIDVEDYLQKWQDSLELKIVSLVDTLVEKRVEEILGAAHHFAKIEHSEQTAPVTDEKSMLVPKKGEELLDDYQIDSDYEDEPDEILTDFLEP